MSSASRLEELERDNTALRRALRLLHALANLVRSADEPEAATYAVLTGVTAGIGLGMNRAMVFVGSAADPSLLLGTAAIGPSDRDEAERVWRSIEVDRPDLETLYEVGLRQLDHPGTLDRKVRGLRVDARGAGARTPIALALERSVFAEGDDDLDGLFDLPTTIAAPMRSRGGRVGVLVADNCFTGVVPDATTRTVFDLVADHAGRALESARRFARVAREARLDPLTGLDTRRVGLELVEHAMASARAGGTPPLGLVLIDLDDFKKVNDQHGHLAGDAVLSAIGERLRSIMRRGQRVFRYGGEEIAMVIEGADLEGARVVGERARAAVRDVRVRLADGTIVTLTCSVGVASSAEHDASATALIGAADAALLRAKAAGKDRVECADRAISA